MRTKLFVSVLTSGLFFTASAQQWQNGTAPGSIYYSGGFVGIGTSPSYGLDVMGITRSRYLIAEVPAAGDVGGWFRGAANGNANVVLQGNGGSNRAYWITATNDILRIGGQGAAEPAEGAMNIRHDGKIGIGTSDPGIYNLAVNGKMVPPGLIMCLAGIIIS
ncbi:hypothetical protein [Paraflavitalea speifideaquila]|uniref:hypothetical protein n=1 Tax=Paraflavitalea speifideaquila TaxID=3076558 RepID=UPI0028EBAEE3|nr:hypothetical protein [Paraflavitalea speifideiaquila]